MKECIKDCLSCADSFSEPTEIDNESDILHCMLQNGKVVEPDNVCEEWN